MTTSNERLSKPSFSRWGLWCLFVVLSVAVGTYPLLYLIARGKIALMQFKSNELLTHPAWLTGFYTHILAGGVALAVGWSQFVPPWRVRYTSVHRWIGKLYILAVIVSATAAICIAPFSTAGLVPAVGFGSLGIIWLAVTLLAWRSVMRQQWHRHEQLMIYSYAACFSAVTLRVWLPILLLGFQLRFQAAYPIVAWLCWVPNLMIAYWINSRKD